MSAKTPSRRLTLSAASAALAVGIVALAAVPAQASPFFLKDTFDTPNVWSTTVVGNGTATVVDSGTTSTSPGNGRYGSITSSGNGFSSVGRTIALPSGTSCSASVYIDGGINPAKVNVEVIRPSSWTYLSLKTVNLGPYSEMSPVSFTLNPAWGTVVFRVSVLGGGTATTRSAGVDNLQISCW